VLLCLLGVALVIRAVGNYLHARRLYERDRTVSSMNSELIAELTVKFRDYSLILDELID